MDNDERAMIAQGNWDKFLTLNGEQLLLVKRRHPFVVFFPILFITFIVCLMIFCAAILFTTFFPSPSLFITTVLLLISVLLTFITKSIMDWYFHLYILTSRKILEVWYAPLYSHVMNDVLLDQVNCTQVDFRRSGFLNELMDMGDVVLTFDRPTHQEEFIFKDVSKCYKLGVFLTRKLLDRSTERQNNVQPIWYKTYSRGVDVAK
jgi:membrane-associated HD superfamily phosphohydrolase